MKALANPTNRIRVTLADGLWHLEFNPAQVFSAWDEKRHSNAGWELHLVCAGSCTVTVEQQALSLCAGEALIIFPGAHHASSTTGSPFSHLSLSFSISKKDADASGTGDLNLCDPFHGNGGLGPCDPFRGAGGLSPCDAFRSAGDSGPFDPSRSCGAIFGSGPDRYRVLKAGEETLRAAEALMREADSPRPYQGELLSALITEVFLRILRLAEGPAGPAQKTGAAAEGPFDLSRVRTDLIDDFFEKNHAGLCSEDALARTLHISRRQLARVLKRSYGMSFAQKLLAARLDHALWLLQTTDKSIAAISEAAGFSSEGALYRRFRETFGKTPGQYRKSL